MPRRKISVWARNIRALRKRLGLSQSQFASRLHYSAMAVSRWETGAKEPTAGGYIQLGNLAGEPDCWAFWSRAGIKSADLSRMFPKGIDRTAHFTDFEMVAAGGSKKRPADSERARLVAIPVLPVEVAGPGQQGHTDPDFDHIIPDEMIAAPALWCPNPADTTCLRVKGSSMAPMINDGDIVALDGAQTDPGELSGKVVVAWHREKGLALSRFLLADGVHILESENHEYDPIVLGSDRNWRIVGKVLWWIRKAP